MRKATATSLRESESFVSSAELGEVIGVDIHTINNWIRHGIIVRASIGGRPLRSRLFSMEEVHKAALLNDLVKLGLPPSDASKAVRTLWREWDKKESLPERIYGVVLPDKDKWVVALCWQKGSGGPLYKFGKTVGPKSSEPFDLPDRTFAMLPISNIFDRIGAGLSKLVG
jgi:hypothetical protein